MRNECSAVMSKMLSNTFSSPSHSTMPQAMFVHHRHIVPHASPNVLVLGYDRIWKTQVTKLIQRNTITYALPNSLLAWLSTDMLLSLVVFPLNQWVAFSSLSIYSILIFNSKWFDGCGTFYPEFDFILYRNHIPIHDFNYLCECQSLFFKLCAIGRLEGTLLQILKMMTIAQGPSSKTISL